MNTALEKSFDDLSGDVAVVTGASSGLGERFALVLASRGANVALLGRRADRLQAVAEIINQKTPSQALPVALDMRRTEDFAGALDEIESRLGQPSILINNAGVPDSNYAMRLSDDKIDQVMETNLRGPFALACEFGRRLKQAGVPGRVVNVASMLAFDYSPNSVAPLYSMTKSAIVRMTEVLALEWASFGINVNAIAPGLFESEMTSGMMQRMDVESVVKRFPRQRIGKPSDLDSTLLFLVSPASRMVTGTIVKVDDGQGRR
ncbi:MAG: SDR family oxidoreductase [Pseudomonadota bacterium]